MRDRPSRGTGRINLIWVIGVAAGVIAGGIVAYSLAGSSPGEIAGSR